MATRIQNENFITNVVPKEFLDIAIEWIEENLKPEDIFDNVVLVETVEKFNEVEDVFNKKDLHDWAINNGYELTNP